MPADRAIKRLASEGRRFDRVFLDPPYGQGWIARTLSALDDADLVVDGGWIVVEHGGGEPVEPVVGHFTQELNRRYGDTHIAIYRRATATHDDADA